MIQRSWVDAAFSAHWQLVSSTSRFPKFLAAGELLPNLDGWWKYYEHEFSFPIDPPHPACVEAGLCPSPGPFWVQEPRPWPISSPSSGHCWMWCPPLPDRCPGAWWRVEIIRGCTVRKEDVCLCNIFNILARTGESRLFKIPASNNFYSISYIISLTVSNIQPSITVYNII